jgi:hypothetical protein
MTFNNNNNKKELKQCKVCCRPHHFQFTVYDYQITRYYVVRLLTSSLSNLNTEYIFSSAKRFSTILARCCRKKELAARKTRDVEILYLSGINYVCVCVCV